MKSWRAVVGVGLMALLFWPGPARGNGDSDIKLHGVVDVPPLGPGSGGTLTLPLPPGSPPVTLNLFLGIPSIVLPITITAQTDIEGKQKLPVTLADGDQAEIEVEVVGSILVATELEVEEFPELELRGTAQGLPGAGVALPLPLGSTLDFTLSLAAGIDLPVRLTGATKVEDAPFTLFNGSPIEIDAIVRDFVIVITEIEPFD